MVGGQVVVDDSANKCVLFEGPLAFSYTGVARVVNQSTESWLAGILHESPSPAPEAVGPFLADASRRCVPSGLPLAIVGAGWTDSPGGPVPVLVRVSNLTDLKTFDSEVRRGRRGERHFEVTGQDLPARDGERLRPVLKRLTRTSASPEAIVERLVAVIRRVSERNKTVGRNLLSVVLPRPYGEQHPGISAGGSPTFRYWDDGQSMGTVYGPTIATRGVVATGFRGGSLKPALGGGGKVGPRFEYQFPVAILVEPDGGVSCARNDCAYALIVFTDRELAIAFRASRPTGTKISRCSSAEDLKTILRTGSPPFTHVYFNFLAGDEREAVIEAAELLD
jgi:hypothetical protein